MSVRGAAQAISLLPKSATRAALPGSASTGRAYVNSPSFRGIADYSSSPVQPREINTSHTIAAKLRPSISSRRIYSTEAAAPGPGNEKGSALKKTALYDLHVEHGGKMAPFAGYSMPLLYSDLSHVQSHAWTREKASLFDVGHMVQHNFRGPRAMEFLMKVTPTSLHLLKDNQSTLSVLLEPLTGGIIDDTIVTRLSQDSFGTVTNAARRVEDIEFLMREFIEFKEKHGDQSLDWEILNSRAMVALQGPEAASTLQSLISSQDASSSPDLSTLYFGQCRQLHLTLPDGTSTASPLLIWRTGYTGEDGFEISIPTDRDPELPQRVARLLLADDNVRLAGLAARDSLRLEAGMCLYGHDISTAQTPPSAALTWVVGKDRRDATSPLSEFNGSSSILPQIAAPATLEQRRVGLRVEAGPPAREGSVIVDMADGKTPIGIVTSGLPSPSLQANIAMGYVKNGLHKKGTEVGVLVRKRLRKAVIAPMPFVANKFYRAP